jgi:hypothetical protein
VTKKHDDAAKQESKAHHGRNDRSHDVAERVAAEHDAASENRAVDERQARQEEAQAETLARQGAPTLLESQSQQPAHQPGEPDPGSDVSPAQAAHATAGDPPASGEQKQYAMGADRVQDDSDASRGEQAEMTRGGNQERLARIEAGLKKVADHVGVKL